MFTIFTTCPPPQRLLLPENLFFFFKWGGRRREEEGKEEDIERGAGDSNEGSTRRRRRIKRPHTRIRICIHVWVWKIYKPPKELQMSVVQPPGCLPAKVSFISSSSFPFRIFSGDLFSFSPIINSFVLSFGICSLSFFQSRPVVVSTFMDLSL